MRKSRSILRDFLKRHQKDNSSLLFWSQNLTDYCKGRLVDFDETHLLLKDYDEETERPYDFVLRLDSVAAIYPSLDQKEQDDRFQQIMKGYLKEKRKKPQPPR